MRKYKSFLLQPQKQGVDFGRRPKYPFSAVVVADVLCFSELNHVYQITSLSGRSICPSPGGGILSY